MGGFLLSWQTGEGAAKRRASPKGEGIVTTRLQKRKNRLWMDSKAGSWLKCCYRFNLRVQLAAMQDPREGR